MPKAKRNYRPVVLVILDGFGISAETSRPACDVNKCSTFFKIEQFFPFTALQASGIAVGLPWGEAGDSEVGHLAIGAGRVIYNYLPKISTAISDGSFFQNEVLLRAVSHVKKNNSAMHFCGLFSTGTVHAYFEHLYALLGLAKQNDLPRVYLHLFTDGKDAKKNEGARFYRELEQYLADQYPQVKISSIIGRGFAMNRDGDWEKTKVAYDLFTHGAENKFLSAGDYLQSQYEQEVYDSSVKPAMVETGEGRISDSDALVFFNFREDSMRQLSASFAQKKFSGFERKSLNNLFVATMTEYDKEIGCPAAFESAKIDSPLAKIVSENALKQLHVAETEKYAHITYFLNGGQESPLAGEDRILIPSPETEYDQVPEMSAAGITNALLTTLDKYDFIAVNFANADMVGHTGNLKATKEAVSFVDIQLGRLFPEVLKRNGCLVITADHGNAEEKVYKITGENRTKHSNNPVPFYVVANDFKRAVPLSTEEISARYKDVKGALADVAPTVLELLGLKKPPQMTGESLLGKMI